MMYYLSTTNLVSDSAQAIQIRQMSEAFAHVLGESFSLVLPQQPKIIDSAMFVGGRSGQKRWRRTMAYLGSLDEVLTKDANIFTREITLAFWALRKGHRVVYEMHKPFETMIGRLLFSFCIKYKTFRLVCISQALADTLGKTTTPMTVLHDAYDPSLFAGTMTKPLMAPLRVMYVGSLQQGKGSDTLIQAAPLIADTTIIIVGGSSNAFSALPSNVTHLPRVPHKEVPALLASADVLVLPMHEQLSYAAYASPLKLFEYMAAKRVLVVSDCGTVREIVDESSAYFFEPNNPQALAKVIKKIASSPDEAQEKVSVAFGLLSQYTWEKRANAIMKLYE